MSFRNRDATRELLAAGDTPGVVMGSTAVLVARRSGCGGSILPLVTNHPCSITLGLLFGFQCASANPTFVRNVKIAGTQVSYLVRIYQQLLSLYRPFWTLYVSAQHTINRPRTRKTCRTSLCVALDSGLEIIKVLEIQPTVVRLIDSAPTPPPPYARFLVGCSSPLMRLAGHLTAPGTRCKQYLPGR